MTTALDFEIGEPITEESTSQPSETAHEQEWTPPEGAPPDATPEAPYGYFPDGRVRKRRPRRPGAKAPGRKPGVKRGETDYRPVVASMAQMVAAALFGVGASIATTGAADKAGPWLADSAVLVKAEPAISSAVHNLAQQNAGLAAFLDRIASVGPYGELILALAPVVAQVAVNHGRAPVGLFGTVDPQALIADMMGRAETA